MIKIVLPTSEHINQIGELNSKFLITQLSDKQRQDGFIRIEYNIEDLHRIITNREIVVAIIENKVIGYYLIGKKSGNPALQNQSAAANNLTDITIDQIGYGCQVCMEVEHRKNGLFKAMFDRLEIEVKDKYSHLLCSVSESNTTSLKVHTTYNWQILDTKETTHFLIYSIDK